MTLQLKYVLIVMLTVAVGVCSSWIVSAHYAHDNLWLPALLLILATAAQIGLVFVKSREEQEFDLNNELRVTKVRHRIAEAQILSERITLEVQRGDLQSVVDWKDLRDKL
jgi:hypothetical protein